MSKTAFDRFLPVVNMPRAGQVECKVLVSTNAIHCSVAMTKFGKLVCNSPGSHSLRILLFGIED